MKWNCINCGKERHDMPSRAKIRKYCCHKCQMEYEYNHDIRDKYKITEKANETVRKNGFPQRRGIPLTEEHKEKIRNNETLIGRVGENNPMYGKTPWNYIDGKSKAYRGPDLKKIRKRTKQRDNYTCQTCGITEIDNLKNNKQPLQVHHIVPYRIFQDNSDDNLITNCSECHGVNEYQLIKVHSIKQIKKKEEVYNFSVDEDESYIANRAIVHNCRSTVIFRPK